VRGGGFSPVRHPISFILRFRNWWSVGWAIGGGWWFAVRTRLGELQVMDVDVGCCECDDRDV
jgi:hypothetical protein